MIDAPAIDCVARLPALEQPLLGSRHIHAPSRRNLVEAALAAGWLQHLLWNPGTLKVRAWIGLKDIVLRIDRLYVPGECAGSSIRHASERQNQTQQHSQTRDTTETSEHEGTPICLDVSDISSNDSALPQYALSPLHRRTP